MYYGSDKSNDLRQHESVFPTISELDHRGCQRSLRCDRSYHKIASGERYGELVGATPNVSLLNVGAPAVPKWSTMEHEVFVTL